MDPPPITALGQHLGDLGLQAEEGAFQVDRDDAVEIRFGLLDEGCDRAFDAGVVAGAVQPTIGRDRPGDQRLDLGRQRHVGAQEPRLAALGADHRRGFLAADALDIRDHDLRPFGGEFQRRRASDPRRGAGDQRGVGSGWGRNDTLSVSANHRRWV